MSNRPAILIVEDDQKWREILRDTLVEEGYDAIAVSNYQGSRQALEKRHFDLVLLDLELDRSAPVLEGQRLLSLISRHHLNTPCIVISGKGDTQIVRDAFKRYQVVDYITKENFDIPNFITAVHTILTSDGPTAALREAADKESVSDSSDPRDSDLQTIPEYEDILRIIQNMGEVMERGPSAFVKMGEEDLRHHFLVQLNGKYAGNATGETFNFTGKTDILIRVNGKNIFIAECKFWKGPKVLRGTIDQLLGYVNWRDTKTAILLFNRSGQFSHVLAKIPEILTAHPCFKDKIETEEETVFRYIFRRPDDADRELLLTVVAFNIPRPDRL